MMVAGDPGATEATGDPRKTGDPEVMDDTYAEGEAFVVDGSQGQGGGQSLRVALFLSTLLRRPLEFVNIRYDRPKPGLRPQHLHGLRTVRDITQASLEGDEEGSTLVRFTPGAPRPGNYVSDPGTAGSITLMLQTLLPIAVVTPGRLKLRLRGGTDVTHAPTWDWFENVYIDWLGPLFKSLVIEHVQRGFYPKGGGEVRVITDSAFDEVPDLKTLRAHVKDHRGVDRLGPVRWPRVEGRSIAHDGLTANEVAGRQVQGARRPLVAADLGVPRMETRYVPSRSMGTAVALWAGEEKDGRIGGDALGAPGKRAEVVGQEAAEALAADIRTGATMDRHMADHLVPWIALGAGAVRIPRETDHVRDAVRLTRRAMGEDAVGLDDDLVLRGRA